MKRLVASLFTVSLLFAVSPAEVHAADCDAASATLLPVSTAGQPIAFYGEDIGEESMALLWDLGMKWDTHDFGKAIAAGQNWFGECKYPGIGLGTGSGWSWHDRNVTLWIWADGVDLAQAANTIHSLVQPAPTTTTTVMPEPESIATTRVLDEPLPVLLAESTTTTTTTTTTIVAPIIAASFAVAVAPDVKIASPAVQKKAVKKVVKKKVVKKKVKVKIK